MVLRLTDLNAKEWARQAKWEVSFQSGDGPTGFQGQDGPWLPATNLTTPIYNISSYDWSSGHRTFSLPKALDYPDISMTLLDDDDRTIKKFLREWFEVAFPENGGIQYLSEIVKVLNVRELKLDNTVVETESYIVFPVGSTASPFSSDPGIKSYTVNFKIAGYSRR